MSDNRKGVRGMVKILIPMIVLVALSMSGCATYICETKFSSHIEREGEKYWQSKCVTEGNYKAPAPAAIKKAP